MSKYNLVDIYEQYRIGSGWTRDFDYDGMLKAGLKTGVDTGLALQGQKTTTDMIISGVTGKDCDIVRKIKNKDLKFVCLEIAHHPLEKR